jgi:futalosine hydrolase
MGETYGMSSTNSVISLILIPTELEKKHLAGADWLEGDSRSVALCGFGVVAAAARTAQLIAAHTPKQVLLVGIAGTYDEASLPVGQAACFSSVAVDGVGCGQGAEHIGAASMGFDQWPKQRIKDRIKLSIPKGIPMNELLVTGCAASASKEEAETRRQRFPAAAAEDMEGFGVAMACALTSTPLAIVRGISNRVGDRDKQNWQIQEALQAADELARQFYQQQLWEKPR